jgi:ADP-ribosylglycohydrolase
MLGAIAGDIFGAAYEARPIKREDFDLFEAPRFFTDDTVLTVATADAILTDGDYGAAYLRWGRRYPDRPYGGTFIGWLAGQIQGPYNSFGNGSAMRVSPVGWAFDTLDETLAEAARSASVTHSHPEGIKGAQAVATAIYIARAGSAKEEIRSQISQRFGYDLNRTVATIRPNYRFDVTCQGSVPEALIAFFDAGDFEHSIRLAISLGGDADTQAAITGSVAEAFWDGVPVHLEEEVRAVLDEPLLEVLDRFRSQIGLATANSARQPAGILHPHERKTLSLNKPYLQPEPLG